MKVAVVGLWHLGCVTAACLANAGHSVIGFDSDLSLIQALVDNKPPIFEPGLNDLIATMQKQQSLRFTNDPKILDSADIVWITFDTPVDENDQADVAFVESQIKAIAPILRMNTLLLISSQLPVGTSRRLKKEVLSLQEKNIHLAFIPENLRLGKAIEVFTHPDRFVVGLEVQADQAKITELLHKFTSHFIWMSLESAEMTKHAINSFLALSVTFANELASLCEKTNANADDVEKGLKTEARIGPYAYLHAGKAIGGGTLLRDIHYLLSSAEKNKVKTPLISAVLESNNSHQQWIERKIKELFPDIKAKKIAVLGLTYKPNTNTLRRSAIIDICCRLHEQGASIYAYDPAIHHLPSHLSMIQLCQKPDELFALPPDIVIIGTEWPQFQNEISADLFQHQKCVIVDPSGFLFSLIHSIATPMFRYYRVGTPS